MKNILVIGARGFIGSAIVKQLLEGEGCRNMVYGTSSSGSFGHLRLDVTDSKSVVDLSGWLVKNEIPLHAIVYAAGDCKAGGFQKEMADSAQIEYKKKSDLLGQGLLHTLAFLSQNLKDGGHVVVISAASIMEDSPFRLYASSSAWQEALIKWARRGPLSSDSRGIHVHRIAPGAVKDSPFYEGADPKLLPRRMVPVSEVADAVSQALNMPKGHMNTDFFAYADTE